MMQHKSPINVPLSSCMCVFGTRRTREFEQIISNLKHLCTESPLLINTKQGTMSVYSANTTSSLTLVDISSNFFDLMWYIHPSLQHHHQRDPVTSSTSQPPQPQSLDESQPLHPTVTAHLMTGHPCLNQSMCTALKCMLAGNMTIAMNNALNRNTANCEIRIPLNYPRFASAIALAQAAVYVYILWNDKNNVYVIPRSRASSMSSGGTSASHNQRLTHASPSYGLSPIMTTHQIGLMKTKRMFLQRAEIKFPFCYEMHIGVLREALRSMTFMSHEYVSFIDDVKTNTLYFLCIKDTQSTTVHKVEYGGVTEQDLNTAHTVMLHGKKMVLPPPACMRTSRMGLAFPIDPIAAAIKTKSSALDTIGLMFTKSSLCIELIYNIYVHPDEVSSKQDGGSSCPSHTQSTQTTTSNPMSSTSSRKRKVLTTPNMTASSKASGKKQRSTAATTSTSGSGVRRPSDKMADAPDSDVDAPGAGGSEFATAVEDEQFAKHAAPLHTSQPLARIVLLLNNNEKLARDIEPKIPTALHELVSGGRNQLYEIQQENRDDKYDIPAQERWRVYEDSDVMFTPTVSVPTTSTPSVPLPPPTPTPAAVAETIHPMQSCLDRLAHSRTREVEYECNYNEGEDEDGGQEDSCAVGHISSSMPTTSIEPQHVAEEEGEEDDDEMYMNEWE